VRRGYVPAVTVAAIAGVLIGVALHGRLDGSAAAAKTAMPALPSLHGQATWASGERAAPAFALRDQRGRLVSPATLRGRTAVLMFEDSLCKQACPIEGRLVAAAVNALPTRLRPRIVVVSVDPWGDTRHSVEAAIRKWNLPVDASWLLGTRAQLAPVWRLYEIAVQRTKGDIVHSTALYLIDRNGDERAGFLLPFVPGLVTDDLRKLSSET
jgi:protein SCO1/2